MARSSTAASVSSSLVLDQENYQGNAVVNCTDRKTPHTRIIEHKHFEFGTQPKIVVIREYPAAWEPGDELYYAVNDAANARICQRDAEKTTEDKAVLFGGCLGEDQYYDMDKVIASASAFAAQELG